MSDPQPPDSFTERNGAYVPRLSVAEWIVFGILAAALAVINIYTTLLIGWGDTGSVIAVLASVLFLGVISSKRPSVASLNLGQTMASAGGSVGFAVATYAAVHIADPEFDPDPVTLCLLFIVMGLLGTMVGTTVRRYMVRYFWPSGTACAVIQRSVTDASEAGRRPIKLLAIWGSVASLVAIPTKITLWKTTASGVGAGIHKSVAALGAKVSDTAQAAGALVSNIHFSFDKYKGGIGVDPLYYGIGIIVGPRIGLGMVIGGAAAAWGIPEWVVNNGVPPEQIGDWVKWSAISVLTLPTFASILFAYAFRQPAIVPPGFEPGKRNYVVPPQRTPVYIGIAVVAAFAIAIAANDLFGVPWTVTILTIGVSWPLCVMNGRVTADTDINPVRLVAIVLLTVFAFLISDGTEAEKTLALLGMAVIGGTLAGMAVDMMQDFRTGYLVDANPHHQTTVQLVGVVIGAIAAIPFFFVLDSTMGFGEGTPLAAPGAQIWAAMAQAFSGQSELSYGVKVMIVAVSLGGAAYAALTVWPKTARWMPSIFGIGIGMLLPIDVSIAIFFGGLIKLVVIEIGRRRETELPKRAKAAEDANNDTMLVGASIFAAAAVVSVVLILVAELFDKLGVDFIYMAGGH